MWRRRLISLTALATAFVAAITTLPLTLTAALLYDLVRGSRFAASRAVLFVVIVLNFEVLGVAKATALWVRLKLDPAFDQRAFDDANFRLQAGWGRQILAWTVRLYGATIEIGGLETTAAGPYLLLPRHASVADTVLWVAFVTSESGVDLRYVLKEELLWDPCIDIVGHRRPTVFVKRDSRDTEGAIARVAALGDDLGPMDGVLIYPEGRRFSQSIRSRIIQRYEEARDTERAEVARRLRHLLPPRLGGPLALLDRAPQADVVFCAHTGFDGFRSARDLWDGKMIGRRIRIVFWRVSAGDVPPRREARIRWLNEQWELMDRWVEANQAP